MVPPRRSAVLIIATMLALTGCVPTATAPAADTASTSAAPDGSGATPTAPTQAALAETLSTGAADLLVPGAVALLRIGSHEVIATTGTRSIDSTEPVTVDDHIRIGSNTKTMTATIVLQLVDEGRISLDDSVSTYRPDIPDGDRITIANLLSMRSGLGNYSETYAFNAALDADPQRVWDPEELITLGTSLDPTAAPGTEFHYSNTNTVILGRIIEAIEGAPLADVMQRRLFDPAGLSETYLPGPADAQLPAPYADGYMYTDNVRTLGTAALPPDLLQAATRGDLLPGVQTNANPSWAWAAGAVVSTAGDLADWAEILGSGAMLSEATQATRLASIEQMGTDATAGYGLGLAKFGAFYGHTGELPGYNSFMGYDPEHDVTLVVWTNLAPAPTGTAPATTIARSIIDGLYAAK